LSTQNILILFGIIATVLFIAVVCELIEIENDISISNEIILRELASISRNIKNIEDRIGYGYICESLDGIADCLWRLVDDGEEERD
jgi:hypothetical protein